MHVGTAVIFQSPGAARPDHAIYADELALIDLAEPLGFESVWGVEHHFTDYTMCPDVLQYLTWIAARTRTVQLGSMVVVLPWHDPLRVAEQICMLDAMSGGRMILGIGRGLGRVEFDGFRLSMEEARGRFVESAEMLLTALETGICEYDGRFVRQPRVALRPAPAKSFRGRTYAAAVSAESMPIVAKLGTGVLIIPQKPWETMERELADYRAHYRTAHGTDAPPPVLAGWTFCDEDAGRAREMAVRYIGGYWDSVMRHYELVGDHLARTVGYEYYAKLQEVARAKGGSDALTEFFLDLQVWGTPEQCFEKIVDIRRRTGCGTYVGVFSYAGMPMPEAERNMRLFASAVMPRLKALGGDDAVRAPAAQSA